MSDWNDRARDVLPDWHATWVNGSSSDIRTAFERAVHDLERHAGREPEVMIVSPAVRARLIEQLAYMETWQYKLKRYVRMRVNRARIRILRRWCPHPYARVYVDSDGTYCTMCKQIDI